MRWPDVLTILDEMTSNDSNDIVHTTCCFDEKQMLCGLKADLPLGHRAGDVFCVPCELAQNRDECPKYGLCLNSDSCEN